MKKIAICIFFIIVLLLPFSDGMNVHAMAEPARYGLDEFYGSSLQETATETISYTRKEEAEFNVTGGLPKYSDGTGLSNICAVLAGANLVGYYDRFMTNMIPDFTPARVIFGQTVYTNSDPKIQELITGLHGRMGSSSTGTTLAGFKNGLSSYAGSMGYNVNYNDVGSDFSAVEAHTEDQNLVALFMLRRFNFVHFGGINSSNNTDTILKEIYLGNHVALAYGYRVIKYYNGESLVETKRFYKVNTGHLSAPLAYIQLDETVDVENSLCITVS